MLDHVISATKVSKKIAVSQYLSLGKDFTLDMEIYLDKKDAKKYKDYAAYTCTYIEEESNDIKTVSIYRCRLAGLDVNEPRKTNFPLITTAIHRKIHSNNGWFLLIIHDTCDITKRLIVTLYDPETYSSLNEDLLRIKNSYGLYAAAPKLDAYTNRDRSYYMQSQG